MLGLIFNTVHRVLICTGRLDAHVSTVLQPDPDVVILHLKRYHASDPDTQNVDTDFVNHLLSPGQQDDHDPFNNVEQLMSSMLCQPPMPTPVQRIPVVDGLKCSECL